MTVAENLAKKYQEFAAVDGVSFEVADGESFGLLGPDGAGKSTPRRMVGAVSTRTDVLFSPTFCPLSFCPLSFYPQPIQDLTQALPLWHGVGLVRGLTAGQFNAGLLWHVLYHVAMILCGLVHTTRRGLSCEQNTLPHPPTMWEGGKVFCTQLNGQGRDIRSSYASMSMLRVSRLASSATSVSTAITDR